MKVVVASLLLTLVSLVCCLDLGDACTTSAECSVSECCLNRDRPRGKRQLQLTSCVPRGKAGDGCLKRYSVYNSSHTYFKCPCAEGLTCKGTGVIDIPLGEMGTCVQA